MAIHLKPGNYNLNWQWHETPIYTVLRIIGQITYGLALCITFLLLVIAIFTRRIAFASEF
jgi:hypothetical protein